LNEKKKSKKHKNKSIERAAKDFQTVKNTFKKKMNQIDTKTAQALYQELLAVKTCEEVQNLCGLDPEKYKLCMYRTRKLTLDSMSTDTRFYKDLQSNRSSK
jgi:DUF438 domain-containing protein